METIEIKEREDKKRHFNARYILVLSLSVPDYHVLDFQSQIITFQTSSPAFCSFQGVPPPPTERREYNLFVI